MTANFAVFVRSDGHLLRGVMLRGKIRPKVLEICMTGLEIRAVEERCHCGTRPVFDDSDGS